MPPGFSTDASRQVRLDRDQPLTLALTLRANRSISGRASAGVTSITVHPFGTKIPVDNEGRFSIRSLPAGSVTLRARVGGRVVEQQVNLPHEPVSISDIDLR